MYKKKTVFALIPARAGSKGVPGKNHVLLNGKPLVAWSFQAAKGCSLLDEIICSTNDEKVLACARMQGITSIRRPARLAKDTTPMLDVILHTLLCLKKQGKKPDYLVLLQPTSPLRTGQDITRAIRLAIDGKATSLASVSPVALRPGLLMLGEPKQSSLYTYPLAKKQADIRRQDAAQLYIVNGAIYVWKTSFLRLGAVLNAPEQGIVLPTSHTLDIDTREDFKACEKAFSRRRQRLS